MSRKFVKIKSTARPPEKLVWIKSGPGAHKLAQKFPTMDPEPPAAGSGRVSYLPPPSMLPHRPTLPRTHVTRLTLTHPD